MGLNKRLIGAGATGSGGLTPSENFKVVTYTGNDGTQNIDVGFKPDLVWIKNRNNSSDSTFDHSLFDSQRGTFRVRANSTGAANDYASHYGGITSNGFQVKSGLALNDADGTYVAWCWKANGGTTSSNTDGTNIDSTVQVNADAGFSIVKFTTPSTFSASNTVGHGLGVIPDLIIMKSTSTAGENWMVHHTDLGNGGYIRLNTTGASGTAGNLFTGTTSTVFNPADTSAPNISYIAYCFHSVDGFSKFGSYTGNGSANGPIVETGFEPAFIMVKQTDDTSNWVIVDNKRSTTNPRDKGLRPNTADSESTVSNNMVVDFLSNGFQLKQTSGSNANNGNFIYMAFAADPDTQAPTLADSFSTVTYTGNSTSNRTIDTGFDANFIWIKKRNATESHVLVDSLRPGSELYSNATNAQSYYSDNPKYEKGSNGFIVGNTGGANGSGNNYVAWAWKADDNEPTIFGGPAKAVYKFEDNANDVTGDYNATANNITYTSSGKFNKAADFNGTNSYAETSLTTNLTSFTWSCWINPDVAWSGDITTIVKGFYSGASNTNYQYLGYTGGDFRFQFRDNTTTAHVSSSVTPAVGQWSHIVATVDGGTSVKIYINGVLTGSGTNSRTISNTNAVSIGGASSIFGPFDGQIDQVRIYQGAIAQEQVTELYNETASDNDDLTLGAPPKSIVSANANAGFSIVKYTSTGVSGTKIPHGLSAAPNLILIKCISDGSTNWIVHHSSLGNSKYLTLNDNSVQDTSTNWLVPSATTFALNQTFGNANTSGRQYIAYCWHSVSGYSAFGSYAGNGTSQSINIGFQPDLLILRKYDDNQDWMIWDSVRDGNPKEARLEANNSDAEVSGTTNINFTSTGFEFTSGFYNDSGQNSIYMAFKIN